METLFCPGFRSPQGKKSWLPYMAIIGCAWVYISLHMLSSMCLGMSEWMKNSLKSQLINSLMLFLSNTEGLKDLKKRITINKPEPKSIFCNTLSYQYPVFYVAPRNVLEGLRFYLCWMSNSTSMWNILNAWKFPIQIINRSGMPYILFYRLPYSSFASSTRFWKLQQNFKMFWKVLSIGWPVVLYCIQA